jgi:inorganic pyrophosphatase
MNFSKATPGSPEVVNVFIECVKGLKDCYEYDQNTDNFILKGVLDISFPGAYGFVPKTHNTDSRPLDVLVLTTGDAKQGVIWPSRPIGLVRIKGQIQHDDVLIAVPISDPKYDKIRDISQIGNLDEIKAFLESFKKSKVEFVFDANHARKSVEVSIKLYKRSE